MMPDFKVQLHWQSMRAKTIATDAVTVLALAPWSSQ